MKHFYHFLFSNQKKKKLIQLLNCFALIAATAIAEAQVSSYSFTQAAGNYASISGSVLGAATGNTSATNLNSNVYPLTLPFNFVFNGVSYNSLNVSSNGFVTFGATAPGTTATIPLSNTTAYDGAISVFGRDLSSVFNIGSTTGDISWETIGTAPNREAIIQWRNFRPNSSVSTSTAYTFSFQIRLQETSNVIQMVYSNGAYLVGSTSISGTAQIGLRGTTANDFNTRLNETTLEFINSVPGTANSSTQAFSTTNAIPGMPAAGLTYTWTPPTCYAVSGLTAGATTTNSAAISWTSSPSVPAGYDIYYSTSSTSPTSSTPPVTQNVSGTSASIGSLTPSTVYYVWVRSNCGSGNTSAWSLQPIILVTKCQPPNILSSTGATACSGSTAILHATADTGATVKWYDAGTNGNLVGTGNSFTTPPLSSTTHYYASAANVTTAMVGKTTIEPNASGTGAGITSYLEFTALSDFTLQTLDLYPYSSTAGTTGTVTIELRTSTGTLIRSATVNVTGYDTTATSLPQTVTLNFPITGGAGYRLGVGAWTGITNMFRDVSNIAYPYSLPGVVNITGTNLSTNYYYFFYNWKVSTNCESSRQQVTATLDSNCLSTSEVNAKDKMKVYPNPFKDIITISDIEKVKSIQVFDSGGRMMKTIDHPSQQIYLGHLEAGLYILHLTMKDGSSTRIKAIKN
ncbi:T9SS type A sorting domain-containing protein [Chryseobacterium sp. OSA05B]|uniref:Ig-like domain-containing protein n=1 Tax=Chryseobacterium sp. OSA05B TaxID=2862650 RepID=UPI001CBE71ED|nr:T9SS type A sorting domain-containing protein [Chryseobacterium sp. OSA05B]